MKNEDLLILMADDDPDDRLMAQDAVVESRIRNKLQFVQDGEELLDRLQNRGIYEDAKMYPKPGLILLDLNMPKKDGREALKAIKGDEHLKRIPVVVLTTSKAEEDILQSYDVGANAYIVKPVTFKGLVDAMKSLGRFWLEIVELPDP